MIDPPIGQPPHPSTRNAKPGQTKNVSRRCDKCHTVYLATRKTRKRKAPSLKQEEVARLQQLASDLDIATQNANAVGRDIGRELADELFVQHRLVRSPKFDP